MGVGEAISPSLTDLTIPDGEGKTSSEVRRTERVGEKDHRLFSRKVALGFRGGKMEDGRNRGRPAPETQPQVWEPVGREEKQLPLQRYRVAGSGRWTEAKPR